MDFRHVIDAARLSVAPVELKPGTVYATLGDDGGIQVVDTDGYAGRPRQFSFTAIVHDIASFVAYLDLRGVIGREDIEVWADRESASVAAVLDPAPGWRADQVLLLLPSSVEWAAWTRASGELFNQADFADFIEDQLSTIVEPDGATLLEIAQTMQGRTSAVWQSASWLANGARSFQWSEETEAKAGVKGTLEIPARFTLALRPYRFSTPTAVSAALRYRVTRGELKIGFKLLQEDQVIEKAFNSVVTDIDGEIAANVMRGKR